jgi:hypothetical protein
MTQGQAGMTFPMTRGGISEAGTMTPVEVHVTGTKSAPEINPEKTAPTASGEDAALTSAEPTGQKSIGSIEGAGLPYTAENADFGPGNHRPEPGPPKFIGREGPNPTPLTRLQQNQKAPDTGIGIQKKKS